MAEPWIAQRIVELRAMGLSYRRIADYLNRKRIPAARADHWSAMTVRNIHVREQQKRHQSG